MSRYIINNTYSDSWKKITALCALVRIYLITDDAKYILTYSFLSWNAWSSLFLCVCVCVRMCMCVWCVCLNFGLLIALHTIGFRYKLIWVQMLVVSLLQIFLNMVFLLILMLFWFKKAIHFNVVTSVISFLFLSFWGAVISGDARKLLLALHSIITPGSTREKIQDVRSAPVLAFQSLACILWFMFSVPPLSDPLHRNTPEFQDYEDIKLYFVCKAFCMCPIC